MRDLRRGRLNKRVRIISLDGSGRLEVEGSNPFAPTIYLKCNTQ